MKKTIEEIRAAVLAERERLCPNVGDTFGLPLFTLRADHIAPRHYYFGWKSRDLLNGHSVCVVYDSLPADHEFWQMAYRLLGLKSREKDAEIDRLKAELDRFKKASSEVLESAKTLYGDTPIYLLGLELVANQSDPQ